MKAIFIRQHGDTADLKASDVEVPAIGPDEVLVKVEAAGVNPSDVGSAMGRFPDAVLPRCLGRDFAGSVVEGPAELVGLEVWGSGGDLGITRNGTYAEFLALPASAVSRRPGNLSPEQAAAVGVPFITAYSALVTLGGLRQGECVIVSGAAGAVGLAATQLAHARGARVIALVKDSSELSIADSVEAVAQFDRGNLKAVVDEATGGKGADLALNGVGASIFPPMLDALGEGGRQVVYSAVGGREFVIDILPFYRRQLTLLGLNTALFDATQCARILDSLTPLFEAGAFTPPAIDESYPLDQVAEAYGRVSSGKSGKVVLSMLS